MISFTFLLINSPKKQSPFTSTVGAFNINLFCLFLGTIVEINFQCTVIKMMSPILLTELNY